MEFKIRGRGKSQRPNPGIGGLRCRSGGDSRGRGPPACHRMPTLPLSSRTPFLNDFALHSTPATTRTVLSSLCQPSKHLLRSLSSTQPSPPHLRPECQPARRTPGPAVPHSPGRPLRALRSAQTPRPGHHALAPSHGAARVCPSRCTLCSPRRASLGHMGAGSGRRPRAGEGEVRFEPLLSPAGAAGSRCLSFFEVTAARLLQLHLPSALPATGLALPAGRRWLPALTKPACSATLAGSLTLHTSLRVAPSLGCRQLTPPRVPPRLPGSGRLLGDSAAPVSQRGGGELLSLTHGEARTAYGQ